jgi:hypothetical protein
LRRSGTNFEGSGHSHAGRFARSAGGCQARLDASVGDLQWQQLGVFNPALDHFFRRQKPD